MKNKIINKIKKGIPSSLFALLMLVSCADGLNNTNNSTNNEHDTPNLNVERVDFDEILKKATIGYTENFNDSVLVSNAEKDAKLKNQQITVIIEMDGKTTVDSFLENKDYDSYPEFYASKVGIAHANLMATNQSNLASKLIKAGLVDEVYGNYETLMNGFYGKTTYGRMEQIRSFAGVKSAYVSTIYKKPDVKPAAVVSNNTNVDEKTGIYKNDSQYDGSNTIVAVLDSGFDYTHEVFNMEIAKPARTKNDIESILKQTVAYTTETSKGNDLTIDDVYLSSKVPFAYDYADKKPDVFPVESDHGTHVSGIIGGLSDKITGIAPNTQFAWMKVFNDEDGGGDSGDILCALEDAVTIGVDAINLSLGAVGGYSEEVVPAGEQNSLEANTNRIYKAIEDAGISLLTAAGNEYSSGYQSDTGTNTVTNPESGTISSPGSYPASLTVASINGNLDAYALINDTDDAVFFKNVFDSRQEEHKFAEELFAKINTSNLPKDENGNIVLEYVTVPGNGTEANYRSINVEGKIALIKRGVLSFEEKLKNAYAAGAFAAIIYNNVTGSLSMTVGEKVFIPVTMISQEVGEKLASKRKGTLTFNESFFAGPFMSDFSSWGPLADLKLKPEITAHGGNIYSSILGGEYDLMSGTSMATPNTCGIVLVIRDYVKETWPDLDPKGVTQMVNRLLMSTATICLNEVGNPYSPRKQGAGLASLINSTSTQAYLYVDGLDKTKLELGDDPNKTGTYTCTFNIKNISNTELSYDVSNLTMTESVSTDKKAVNESAHMLNPSMDVKATNATLSGTKLTVPANGDAQVTVTLQLNDTDKNYIDEYFKNGMYVEGFIKLNATKENQINLNIPFLSFYGDWLTPPMFDKTYYEVDADRADGSISEKDKTKADLFATTPYGKYGPYYMIPLGGYIYDIDAGYDQIAATEEKAAISIDSENGIYQLYTIYTGLLRGAKTLTMTIENDATGEIVFEKTTYNNRKAQYYGSMGGILPYNDDYSFAMFNEETGDIFANNTKFNVKMVAALDYENGDKVANNSFEFSFYVDYEAPTLENVNYVTEWDKAEKKNRYYVELDVSDNRFVQSIRPCAIVNMQYGKEVIPSLVSLTDNPVPVYQTNANEKTTVKIEITDYIFDLKDTEYPDTIFFMISDYALNSNIFMVSLAGNSYQDLKFNEKTIEVEKNQIVNLNDYVNFENATLQNFTWTSSNSNIVVVDDAQVIGLQKGLAIITGTSPSFGINVKVNIKVKDNDSTPVSSLSKIKFTGYETLFSFDDDYEYSALGSINSKSYMPDNNSFELYPTESFKLSTNYEPWHYDDDKLTIKYTTTDSDYVTVSEDGVVTAVKETKAGPVTIYAHAYENGVQTLFSTSIKVTVKSPFIHQGIILQYYKGPGGVVEIPDDLGLEYIGEYAFSHYTYNGLDWEGFAIREPLGGSVYSTPITKIIVPEGVKIIQDHAFSNLNELEEVILPSTARDIYSNAFENCENLKSINLNSVVKVENNAFNNCKVLENVNTLNATNGNNLSNIVTMGSMAFNGTAIKEVDLLRLRMAGKDTFANCHKLEKVTLYNENPLNVNMFANSAIGSITIPHAIIPTNAFKDCTSINEVIFTNKNVRIEENAFSGCNNLKSIKFADNCTSLQIGFNAFENSSITSLNLPNCEVTISDEAFLGSSIKELVLNENTTLTLYGTPFVSTENFDTVKINGTNAKYDILDNMLVNKEHTTLILVPTNIAINIPESITTIGVGAIAGNKVTTSLLIPNHITSIEDYAFASSSLTSVDFANINENITLGDGLFYDCKQLSTLVNAHNLKEVTSQMFTYSGLTSITLADNVIINNSAFAYCDSLQNVTIGNSATIGDYAFYGAFTTESIITINSGTIGQYVFAESNIKTIIATNVSEVAEGAFMNAKEVVSISIPNIETISIMAFANCPKLESIDISNTTSILDEAFAGNKALTTVIVNDLMFVGKAAFFNASSLTEINLSKVTDIEDLAFANASSLVTIDLGSLKTLGDSAFYECYGISTVLNLEKSELRTIPSNAFYHDSSKDSFETGFESHLETINLSKITEIKDNAFYGNTMLKNVNLENVIKIGEYSFFDANINNLNLAKATDVAAFAFYSNPILTLSIPSLVNVGDCAFAEAMISELNLPDTLVTISYGAFSSLDKLKEFKHNDLTTYVKVDENNKPLWTINEGVLYIYLANGNLQLQSYPIANDRTSYTILEGTTRIDDYSFYTYSSNLKLKEVTLPSTLKTIGDCAFAGYDYDGKPFISTYIFKSYQAPVLEGIYNYSLQDTVYNLLANAQTTEKLENLYHASLGNHEIYNMYSYDYPYYYANFGDYVGFVSGLTMKYPSNGIGYDSLIYTHFFDSKEASEIVADTTTTTAIASLERMMNVTSATIENKADIINAYNDLILVKDEAQKNLLPSDKVAHLRNLYEQVIDLDYPSASKDEITSLVGTYKGIDSDETKFELVINEDGSGTLKVDSLNDKQDRLFTFNTIRHNTDETLRIMTNEDSIFSFVLENKTITLKYFVFDVELNINNSTPDNPDNPSDNPSDTPSVDTGDNNTSERGCKSSIAYPISSIFVLALLATIIYKRRKEEI